MRDTTKGPYPSKMKHETTHLYSVIGEVQARDFFVDVCDPGTTIQLSFFFFFFFFFLIKQLQGNSLVFLQNQELCENEIFFSPGRKRSLRASRKPP